MNPRWTRDGHTYERLGESSIRYDAYHAPEGTLYTWICPLCHDYNESTQDPHRELVCHRCLTRYEWCSPHPTHNIGLYETWKPLPTTRISLLLEP